MEHPFRVRDLCYGDSPLPIGHNQTISSIYTVALMTQALGVCKDHKVLEVGTGSGYQAAVLAQLASEVYSIERIAPLLAKARTNLRGLRLSNMRLKHADGNLGLSEAAPFDSIILSAATRQLPQPLLQQLALGGRMILPFGASAQVKKVAARRGAAPAQVALAWLLARSPVILPIPGTRSLAHLEENSRAAVLELSAADFAALSV